ncbi:C2 domain-containing protein [Polychytrium aggregatum]|uniref:C2 domain-containing protein n=1 Tax=Polychytrium aggregatum TaxID=110093 RepID=UPI0022FE4D07|nr:C2 domain-containing protein [Polychytrium aggregatum]KAI9201963.1 C2 domain-containing protein [Polychytrium aggregatum]
MDSDPSLSERELHRQEMVDYIQQLEQELRRTRESLQALDSGSRLTISSDSSNHDHISEQELGTFPPEEQAQLSPAQLSPAHRTQEAKTEVISPSELNRLFYAESLTAFAYVNSAIVVAWVAGLYSLHFAWIVHVMFFAGMSFRRNIMRLKQKVRGEVIQEIKSQKIATDAESTEWLNSFLERFWPMLEPTLSASIMQLINNVLDVSKPNFLDDLVLKEFTLGSKSPRIESIQTPQRTEADVLILDLDLSFIPIDEQFKTIQQLDMRNSVIELIARVGRGLASISLPILLKELEVRAKVRVYLKFMTAFPHIKTLQWEFNEHPHVDFILRPLKAMDVMDIPGLNSFIKDTVDSQVRNLGVSTIEIASIFATEEPADKPVGILRLIIHEAVNLRNLENLRKSDPYARVIIGGSIVARTKAIEENLDPFWNEDLYIVLTHSTFKQLTNASDELRVEVMDWNTLTDRSMGITPTLHLNRWIKLLDESLSFQTSNDPPRQREADWLVDQWGHPCAENDSRFKTLVRVDDPNRTTGGEVRIDMQFFPVTRPAQPLSAPVLGLVNPPIELGRGILRVVVHQVKELDRFKSLNGRYSPYVVIEVNDAKMFSTPVRRKTNSPVWDAPFQFFCKDASSTSLRFIVKDQRGLQQNPIIGECTIIVKELLDRETNDDWFRLFGIESGKIRLTFMFTPVRVLSEDVPMEERPNGYYPVKPIGVIRVKVKEAKGLKKVDMIGLSDPFCSLYVADRRFGITNHRNATADPVWDETFLALCYTPRELLRFELYGWGGNNKEKGGNRSLGVVEYPIEDLIPSNVMQSSGAGEEIEPQDDRKGSSKSPIESIKSDGVSGDPSRGSLALKEQFSSRSSHAYVNGNGTSEWNDPLKCGWKRIEGYSNLRVLQTPHGADVWAPIYFPKPQTDLAPASHTAPATNDPKPAPFSQQPSGEQKGHMHFEVEFFPLPQQDAPETAPAEPQEDDPPSAAPDLTDSENFTDASSEFLQPIKEYESDVSVLHIRLHDFKSSIDPIDMMPYVEVNVEGEPVCFQTRPQKLRCWEEATSILVKNVRTRIHICVRNVSAARPSPQDPIIGKWVGEIKGLDGSWSLKLTRPSRTKAGNTNGSGSMSSSFTSHDIDAGVIGVSCELVNVPVHHDDLEFQSGKLFIDIIDAERLQPNDLGATMNPYCSVYLDDALLHTTMVHSKTMNPHFDESITEFVRKRSGSLLRFDIHDRNKLKWDGLLGSFRVRLASLPIRTIVKREYQLEGSKNPGRIHVRLLFEPSADIPRSLLNTKAGVGRAGPGSVVRSSRRSSVTSVSSTHLSPLARGLAREQRSSEEYSTSGTNRQLSPSTEISPSLSEVPHSKRKASMHINVSSNGESSTADRDVLLTPGADITQLLSEAADGSFLSESQVLGSIAELGDGTASFTQDQPLMDGGHYLDVTASIVEAKGLVGFEINGKYPAWQSLVG